MDRQFSGRKSLSCLLDDDNIEDQSPSFHHLSQLQNRRLSCYTHFPLDASPLHPLSLDESLWTRTSISSSSHPSLLYCCISSLRHDGDLYSIAVSGDIVMTGSTSRRVHAWQSGDCHAIGYLQASSGEVRAMVAQGNMLFTSHKDHKIRVWSMRSHTCNNSTNNNFKPRKVTTLPNTNHFKNFVLRPSAPQNRFTCKPITPQHKDIISCMAYYHIEGILYTGSFDKTVKAWKLNERKCIDSFIAHSDNINDMVINQQNGYLFTCSSDGTVKMWLRIYGENSHALIKVLSFHAYPIYALALSNQNQSSSFLYSGSFDGCINFWEQEVSCQYNQGKRVLQGHQFAVLCLVAIENFVISGSEDATIRIWRRSLEDRKAGCAHECLTVLEGHRGPVRCLSAFSQKDKFVVSFLVFSASLDQTFKVWRVKLLQEMKSSSGEGEDDKERKKSVEIENGPVLSPSWVKRKLQSRSVNSV
ncbi:protein JINGUBANG-like [Chenopodium quinoa]|uniref:protein JINGUBANG-like n=1 Tax=Chenopodium quinoa TaxID=63459 RepID=UPI000B790FE6|nr:protein JINGUBANG-like [Chenopodium quinoa]